MRVPQNFGGGHFTVGAGGQAGAAGPVPIFALERRTSHGCRPAARLARVTSARTGLAELAVALSENFVSRRPWVGRTVLPLIAACRSVGQAGIQDGILRAGCNRRSPTAGSTR